MIHDLAGAVELFSGTDIAWLLLAALLALFTLPLMGAAFTFAHYRRQARTVVGSSPLGRAGLAFIAVFWAQLVVTGLLDWMFGLVPGSLNDAVQVAGIFLAALGAASVAFVPFVAAVVTFIHYRRQPGQWPDKPSPIGRALLAFVVVAMGLMLLVSLLRWLY